MGNTIPHGDRLHECTPTCPEARVIERPVGPGIQGLLDHFGIEGDFVIRELEPGFDPDGRLGQVTQEFGPALRKREGDQELPTPNEERSCQEMFMDRIAREMPARMVLGKHRYGTLLQAFNGRDFMRDAHDELLDLSVYLEGVATERAAMMDLLYDVATLNRSADDLARSAQILLLSMGQSIDFSDGDHFQEEEQ